MLFHHGSREYHIDDEWWREAGMHGFVPSGFSYVFGVGLFRGRVVESVAIQDVEPLVRNLTHGVFNDSTEFGKARDRVVRILSGFKSGDAIPPVELVALPADEPHRYRLRHGAHRFYSACAAGFSHVPAVVYLPGEVEY